MTKYRTGSEGLALGTVVDNEIVLSSINTLPDTVPAYTNAVAAGYTFTHLPDEVGDDQFFYKITHWRPDGDADSPDRVIAIECGLGSVSESKLVRDRSFFIEMVAKTDPDGGLVTRHTQRPCEFNIAEGDYLIVGHYIPSYLYEALVQPDMLVAANSSPESVPKPVPVPEKTVVGNIGDGIEAMTVSELRQLLRSVKDASILNEGDINLLLSHIFSISDDIVLKTPHLNLVQKDSRVSASILRAEPTYDWQTRPEKPREGDIIFDRTHKTFLGYNGDEWIDIGRDY